MCQSISTYGLMALEREIITPPTLLWDEAHFTRCTPLVEVGLWYGILIQWYCKENQRESARNGAYISKLVWPYCHICIALATVLPNWPSLSVPPRNPLCFHCRVCYGILWLSDVSCVRSDQISLLLHCSLCPSDTGQLLSENVITITQ